MNAISIDPILPTANRSYCLSTPNSPARITSTCKRRLQQAIGVLQMPRGEIRCARIEAAVRHRHQRRADMTRGMPQPVGMVSEAARSVEPLG